MRHSWRVRTLTSILSVIVSFVVTSLLLTALMTYGVMQFNQVGPPVRTSAPKPTSWSDPKLIKPDGCAQWGDQPGDLAETSDGQHFTWATPHIVCRLTDRDADPSRVQVAIQGDVDVSSFTESLATGPHFLFVEGGCKANPAAACITTQWTSDTTVPWQGHAEPVSSADRLVTINQVTSRGTKLTGTDLDHVVCHEMGHALGISHHWQDVGCLGPNWSQTTLSEAELAVLGS